MIWYSAEKEALLRELAVSPDQGLSAEEAAARHEQYGPNELARKKKKSLARRFLEQMTDFMVIILMIAAVISGIVTILEGENNWVEPIVIIAIVLLNAFLGVFQESRAEAALDALKSMAAPQAKVLRDGVVSVISAAELVPGDVILLDAGDFIPADGRLIESGQLRCNESALTGESIPAEKDPDVALEDIAPLGDRANMVYAGCSVAYGRGRAIVTDIGMSTEMGKIAKLLEGTDKSITPLQQKLAKLGKNLGFLALGICAFLFLFGLMTGQDPITMFMTAVSLAVAAIPEGLPAIVTIVLAMGVQRMVKQNAIIRRLPAVETLGSASVICSDKTGTLTQNRMTLVEVYDGKHRFPLEGNNTLPPQTMKLLSFGVLCNDGRLERKDGKENAVGDPTETALLSGALRYGMEQSALETEHPRMAEIPFDSDRKLMTTVHFFSGKYIAVVKGAPDVLLDRCVPGDYSAALTVNEEMASEALRVLAVGWRELSSIPANPTSEQLEHDLTFAGLFGMIDPPRPEVVEAVKTCKKAGIRTIMITGDHIVTACAIARELGILNEGEEALTGAQLAEMREGELEANIRKYSVYARVSPEDKIRIVNAWKKSGEAVSMTGDGVNDAPALKAADIGCAMGITGTDVAKGAADMVLTDDNFATIVSAVRQGRGIYDNIRKAVGFLLSCNLGEVLAVFFAMLFWKSPPLLAIQLLWINLVTDSLPALALGMEPTEYDIMTRPPRRKSEGIFARGLGFQALLQGMMFGAITLIAYFAGRFSIGGDHPEMGQTMAFSVLAFSQLVHAFNARSSHSLFRIGFFSNRWMLGAFAVSVLLMCAVLFFPPLMQVFGLVALPLAEWEWIVGLSLAPLVLVELSKGILFLKKKWVQK